MPPKHARNGDQRLSGFSTVIALAIMVTAAATLHSGITQIESSAQVGHAMARFEMIFVALGERFRGLEVGGGILLGPF